MTKCKRCGGKNCTCKKSIGELAKENPNKTYHELDEMRQKDSSNVGLIIDDTNECESCQ